MGQVERNTSLKSDTVKLYLVTEFGTLACLLFDFNEKAVRDVKVSGYVKSMVCFRIVKIKASENLDVCMLIEHDCLCQIRFWSEDQNFEGGDFPMPSSPNIMNEIEHNLAYFFLHFKLLV